MGPRPLKVMKNAFSPATAPNGSVALPFVIPSAAEGSAVPRTLPGNVFRHSVAPIPFDQGWPETCVFGGPKPKREPIVLIDPRTSH